MSTDRVIAQVRKLLRLARIDERADVATRNEASSAMAEADRLMQKHRLTDEEVSEENTARLCDEDDLYRREIARAIAFLLDCEVVAKGGLAFRGAHENIERAATLFASLVSRAEGESAMPAEVADLFDQHYPVFIIFEDALRDDVRLAWATIFQIAFMSSATTRLRLSKADKWVGGGDSAGVNVSNPNAPEVAEAQTIVEGVLKPIAARDQNLAEHVKQFAFTLGAQLGDQIDIRVPDRTLGKTQRALPARSMVDSEP